MFHYKNFNNRVVYTHGGTGLGAINDNLADSASGVCISVLTNQDIADNHLLFEGVVKALHGVTVTPPTTAVEAIAAPAFRIYPNPAQDLLYIDLEGGLVPLVLTPSTTLPARQFSTALQPAHR